MILEAKNTHQVELLKTSKIASKLYAKHINTELYKKIVESLDQDHPDWRKNSQLGRCAPHLINFVIRFCQQDGIDPSHKNWQKDIKNIINFDYDLCYSANVLFYKQDIHDLFDDYLENCTKKEFLSLDMNEFMKNSSNKLNNKIYWPY